MGDTNLDGMVNGTDLSNLIEGLSNAYTGWQNGDLNYDGVVNGTDYTLYTAGKSYYDSLPTTGRGLGDGTNAVWEGGNYELPALMMSAPISVAVSAVPEPAALTLAAVPLALMGRRRRR